MIVEDIKDHRGIIMPFESDSNIQMVSLWDCNVMTTELLKHFKSCFSMDEFIGEEAPEAFWMFMMTPSGLKKGGTIG